MKLEAVVVRGNHEDNALAAYYAHARGEEVRHHSHCQCQKRMLDVDIREIPVGETTKKEAIGFPGGSAICR